MKVLITGGAGFIGSHLALALVAQGHEVTVLDALTAQVHGERPEVGSPLYRSLQGKVRFIHGSVCDEQAWREALPGQEAIVHLAAETGTGQSMYEIKRYVDVNVGGTALMLQQLSNAAHNVKRIVVASSRAIYGEGKYRSRALGVIYPNGRIDSDLRAGRFDPLCPQTGEPLELLATDEESRIQPSSIYGITKQNQEQMTLTVGRALNIPSVALRYQNVYGPGQSLTNPYTGILSIFSTRILNRKPINVFEDGEESRDFVFIDDVVDATIAALLSVEAGGEAIGIGSGVATSVLAVARSLTEQLGVQVPIEISGAYRLGDIRHNFADLAKARRLLRFEPKVSFADGIARFARWVLAQSLPKDSYESSLQEMAAKGLLKV